MIFDLIRQLRYKWEFRGRTYADHDVINNFRFADEERHLDIAIGNDCGIGQNVFFAGENTLATWRLSWAER